LRTRRSEHADRIIRRRSSSENDDRCTPQWRKCATIVYLRMPWTVFSARWFLHGADETVPHIPNDRWTTTGTCPP
jgi:hypothetical protein